MTSEASVAVDRRRELLALCALPRWRSGPVVANPPPPCRRAARRVPEPAETTTSAVRVRDIASLHGAPPVPLIGYGLVIGLNKTGDRRQTIFSAQTLANMLERFGVGVPAERDQD